MHDLVVIDTETTGFGKLDRIVEIAAVVVDGQSWETVAEFDTLTNPQQDVFPQLAHVLNGRVLVAHNLALDNRMLRHELERLNTLHTLGEGICTLQLAGASLGQCCATYGIQISDCVGLRQSTRRHLEGIPAGWILPSK